MRDDDAQYMIVRRERRYSADQARRVMRRRRLLELSMAVGAPLVLVVAWQITSDREIVNPQFFPAPTKVWDAGVELYRSGELWDAVSISLKRVLIGTLWGSVSGTAAGVLLGTSRLARAALEPLLSALYTVPKLALLPLFLLIFGLGEEPIYLSIAITVFFFMWLSTMAAFLAVGEGHREAAATFEAGRWQMFRHVLFPAALPQIFVGLRLSIGVAVLMMVGVEFSQTSEGIGHLIWYSWTLFQAPQMYVGIVVVALLGLLLTTAVKWVSLLVLPWAREEIRGVDRTAM
jgi:NitT/TauT family transport system permease protein/sulfonate transport system permease protein